ncbi:MAG: hypothetical protein A3J46_04510 [Candidatus Yanofskybacteria bacterium RIFCSPHIGHO2_02_FULL_41_11]|uniref:Uncharacterized protein n=1 Tax=Candidatus Yanofskybacteria bacterium RIFCSPHIGHO2_02_FULL_41_11 TaxID=1802675 RepID=A0A1F8F9W0_9BACT|nr:MAG: hypothetical protein A3J46_04510 [Candidatus Yanofskybacteria bacterium RIFCSPHIGHO2_02_FULL_41_11]
MIIFHYETNRPFPFLVSAFLSREFHCGKADKRKNSSPLPPPSCVCPLPYLAKLRQQFRSKWVRAKFRIHDHSRQIKLFVGDKEVASGLRPSASPRPALRDAANPHGSEKSIWTFRFRRRRFGIAKQFTNEICIQFLTNQ